MLGSVQQWHAEGPKRAWPSKASTGDTLARRQHGEKRLGGGDDQSARWQRRRSTVTQQGGLDGKKRASPMGTRGSPVALDHGDDDDGSLAGTMVH
ncbi:hypothetical protein E2562_008801 [Oryza meyeriana var. granulata]|uniref:Uncharacterized protein n=1 Tax=Oryza meyeriana var. granulata TaxID=110450 RepID=A0A6G1D1W5_9ORYZ|nr:hypothetical protein E2562_008801 [Oryza meyeriana var. granulata]